MTQQQVTFNVSQAKNGNPTVSARIDGQPGFFLHSTVNPAKEAKEWLARVELTPYSAYFVLGFGLGYHVQALLEKLPEGSHIYVLEYSEKDSLLTTAAKVVANSAWMRDLRISYWAIGTVRNLAAALALDMGKRCLNKVTLCRYYPAMAVFGELYQQVEKELVLKVEELFCLNFNNKISLGNRRIHNAWLNVPYICNSPGITEFANRFAGMPAIVVSAGPSLNKNIDVLKKCMDRAVVIASGSTMGALFAQGITPSFLAVGDSDPLMYEVLAEVFDSGTVLLTPYEVQHKVVSEYPGKRLFAVNEVTMTINSIKQLLPDTDVLPQNISVATMALNFALYCGANPIIFVGQDLSFLPDPTAAQHANGVKAGEYSKEEWQKTFVPGYYGGEVPTVIQMGDVIQYLEGMVKSRPDISFINATEGGARISGTVQLKLSEVYDQFLIKDISINSLIDEVYSQFEAPNNTELLKVLLDIREEITRARVGTDEFASVVAKEIEATLEWPQPVCDRLQAQFVSFFEKLSQESIYQYVKPGIEPFQELVEYRIREGMSFQQKVDAYFDLINSLLVVLERLDTAVQEGVVRMEKMQSDIIAKNGRQEQ